MTIHVGVGGASKAVPSISVGVSGAWKPVTAGYVGVGGAWKPFFNSDVLTFTIQAETGFGFIGYRSGESGTVDKTVTLAGNPLYECFTTGSFFVLSYTASSSPGQNYFTSIDNGLESFNTAAATYTFIGGLAKWQWATANQYENTEGYIVTLTK